MNSTLVSAPAALLATLVLAAVAAGCDGGAPVKSGIQTSALMCKAAGGTALATDAAAPGCNADPAFQICSTGACKDACPAAELPVTCTGVSNGGPIPAPDAALGCTVIPIPTPSNVLFYCCPCAS